MALKCNLLFLTAFLLTGRASLSTTSPCRESDTVLTSQEGPVFFITLNRPEVRNAVDAATAKVLFESFRAFESLDDAKVAVFSGSDGTFCSGYDLKSLSTQHDDDAETTTLYHVGQGHAPMGPSRMTCSKPVIAAVEGHAVAGGLELSLVADMR
eukprot:m.65273 g.65273  ORF g.65273 m.65273 type:complete len:154 (-) comp13660_c0_seq3:3010-3471(-)